MDDSRCAFAPLHWKLLPLAHNRRLVRALGSLDAECLNLLADKKRTLCEGRSMDELSEGLKPQQARVVCELAALSSAHLWNGATKAGLHI
eukprot:828-Amphidinium_carterae.1